MRMCLLLFFCIPSMYALEQIKKSDFHTIYPLSSFKLVVDTCMRAYSDALELHDRAANHERCDELLDLLVGRLMRLRAYIEQLMYAYRYEATVTFDELEYLIRLLDYLEVTITDTGYEHIAQALNHLMQQLKDELKNVLANPLNVSIQALTHPFLFLHKEIRLLQFA